MLPWGQPKSRFPLEESMVASLVYEADCLSIFVAEAAEELKGLVALYWLFELFLESWKALTLLTRVWSCLSSSMMLVA